MCANLLYDFKQIQRNIAETKRLMRLTSFQRVNERAADIKADRYLHYQPLARQQLFDELDAGAQITVVTRQGDGELHSYTRSSRPQDGERLNHVRTIQRPTEMRGLLHALGLLVLDSDFPVLRQEPPVLRWCIYCRTRHPISAFIHHKRYANELSFACAVSLKERKHAPWRLTG